MPFKSTALGLNPLDQNPWRRTWEQAVEEVSRLALRTASSPVVICEFDLDGAVIEQFSGALARDLVHFAEALQVKPTDKRLYSMSRPA
jgi:hypothetical protein